MSVMDESLGFDPADGDAPFDQEPAESALDGAAAHSAAGLAGATDEPEPDADASLVALVERLGIILSSTDLIELEVEVGSTALVLRKPAALALDRPIVVMSGPAAAAPAARSSGADSAPGAASFSGSASAALAPAPAALAEPQDAASAAPPSRYRPVPAPLTGIYYTSPSPGAAPYIEVGEEIAIGQVIGLIEAMKLFNEIKSDVAGRVVRLIAENGSLVKAKHPLIEVDPQ